ncbi:MAG: phosphoribosylformylglycinamidine synthase [Bacteroidales bacterium]|nr:phosphoribosylformylglycinamidine synthase [Bacteroidales bacterium]
MILFFKGRDVLFAVEAGIRPAHSDIQKLEWLFANAKLLDIDTVSGIFVGPRREMITPWSTNAVEITQNMGIQGIIRIEELHQVHNEHPEFDPMLQVVYNNPSQDIFSIARSPEPVIFIDDISEYNSREGLALNADEVQYLRDLSLRLGRKLTDSEVFGFSQVNSEHCRHKIFNGRFVIDGKEMPDTLFALIKKTSRVNHNRLVSAYKDNVAFVLGPPVTQFAPKTQDKSDYFELTPIQTVISLKAETHNFPTTVEPFNGASTGSGGEIRDRMAGGKGSIPLAGTAVYMTSYPRLSDGNAWEENPAARAWLYQSPEDILIKASNGASDFGNKFGQPLINGSLLTFEHQEAEKIWGYDKVIMLAGGVGYGRQEDAMKDDPEVGDIVVVMGGDNYRIGMGGGAVSSVATGEYGNAIELNAVQRANPEMQKRVMNAIRAMAELPHNPVVSIHDHGAGGHLNSLSELVEKTGGKIFLDKLPVGDPTLSAREIIGNESQERMGLIMKQKDLALLERIAARERAPMYEVGHTTGDNHFSFEDQKTGIKPMDLSIMDMFGNPPQTLLEDTRLPAPGKEIVYETSRLHEYLNDVLQLEAVACKDWLTNKVDRSVSGRVALQQCAGDIQLPLNNLGIMAIDYSSHQGIATAIGHAPVPSLIDPAAGARLAIAESLTNVLWVPLQDGLKGVSLSANWMWPAKNAGENARLYEAVQAVSDFACALGINIPTGKDSLSMTQKYPDGKTVFSPGTVIISAVAEVSDFTKVLRPVIKKDYSSELVYIDFSDETWHLGGSSFAQIHAALGKHCPDVASPEYFIKAFNTLQQLISDEKILSGHDISSGGLITTLLEMCFASSEGGMDLNFDAFTEKDIIKFLFSERPGVVIQINDPQIKDILAKAGLRFVNLGRIIPQRQINLKAGTETYQFDINALRDVWYKRSSLLDERQCGKEHAAARFSNYKKQSLGFSFPDGFTGKMADLGLDKNRVTKSGLRAAIIREKGVNGDREMAFMLHLAGFDVKDVHMTDLMSGRETLEEVNLIVFVGGFSNSDVLGSAKGWAGAFLYNETAGNTLKRFYERQDTLSLGVCNGCQLMIELGLINPSHDDKPKMLHNASGKFESGFIGLCVEENASVMLAGLAGTNLGIWVAHGEGKFSFPYEESRYNIVAKYAYDAYPANPNGSDYNVAGLVSDCGRHLAIMPHFERAFYPWHWAEYPAYRSQDEVSPWILAFVNAREWIKSTIKQA